MSLLAGSIGREIQLAQSSPDTCESVIGYGADPTGVADSTTAFNSARVAAGTGGSICVPKGDYLVDPDAFEWGDRLWVGDQAHGGVDNTRILARIDGTSLCSATLPVQISNIVFTGGGNTVTNAVFLNGADDSILFNVSGNGCTNGIHVLDTVRVTLLTVGASANAIGFLFDGAHVRAFNLGAASNTTRGIDIIGTGDDTDNQFVAIFGCLLETNTGSEQMRIFGARGGLLSGLYSEGGGDGLLIDGYTRNFSFSGLRFTGGGSPTVAIRISDGSMNTFTQVGAGGSPSTEYSRVRIEGSSALNEFNGMHFGSGVSAIPMDIEFYDGVGSYTCIADNGADFKGDGAPTRGNWEQGQIVFNNSPTASSTLLWRCIASGSPGTWEAVS